MKRIILILLVLFALNSCTPKEKIYYFYNSKELFYTFENSNDSLCYRGYVYRKETHPTDTFTIGGGSKVYGLKHYYKFSNYHDTSFIKPKSYLDSIDYYGTEWFKKDENLDKFWKTSQGRFDSLKIYTIEPIDGTDSLIFRRVHRYFWMIDG